MESPKAAQAPLLVLALIRAGEIVGIQTAHGAPGRGFDEVQVRIAHGVSRLGSLALEYARTMEELKRPNRLTNAFKFTERGCVSLAAEADADGIVFVVSDTGIGIRDDQIDAIFEPFRQGDSGYTRRYGGVGLGLYVVRRVVEMLGGTIAVESCPSAGSSFRVWIPAPCPPDRVRVA